MPKKIKLKTGIKKTFKEGFAEFIDSCQAREQEKSCFRFFVK